MTRFERLAASFDAPPVAKLPLPSRAPVSRALKALLLDVIERERPDVIAEIGAFEAGFARDMTVRYPGTRVIAFEASPVAYEHHRSALAEAEVDYRHLAIGANDGTITIHVPTRVRGREMPAVNRMASLNALAIPDSATEAHAVPVRTLDGVLGTHGGTVALWIDVEGAVKGVIDGAPRTLERTSIVLCELESVALWEGQALADNVMARLREAGLVPAARDCERPHQFNALFLRDDVAARSETALAAFERRARAFVDGVDDGPTPHAAPTRDTPSAPAGADRVATRSEFRGVLAGDDARSVEAAKVDIRRATLASYERPTLNPTHNGHCIDMIAASLVELRDRREGPIDYLEIGTFMGASMVTVGTLLHALGAAGRLVSIDPYFEEGYRETPPGGAGTGLKMSTPETMRRAMEYYRAAGLSVEVVRETGARALFDLAAGEARFAFVYIDGKHEQFAPMSDLALALRVLKPGGHVMLDDVNWPDVRPLYDLCRRHLTLVTEGFDKACFRVDDPIRVL